MGKNAWGCLGAAAAPFLLYAAWISYPPSYYENEMQRRLAQRAAGQAIAADSRKNAYMNPNFLPFWGRPTSERRPGMVAETQIKKLFVFAVITKM